MYFALKGHLLIKYQSFRCSNPLHSSNPIEIKMFGVIYESLENIACFFPVNPAFPKMLEKKKHRKIISAIVGC